MEQNNRHIFTQQYDSPCGPLTLGEYYGKICICDWTTSSHHEAILRRITSKLHAEIAESPTDLLQETACQLDEYFNATRRCFTIPLLLVGTEFQISVWRQLQELPFGTTMSYGQLAKRINRPNSVRAVANANGANAISIIIPCHRIIGSNNTLTGYAGGLAAKQKLIELETKSFFTE
jgi:methylated-DNA-[protein]-cysteine S-methyltransferase